MSHLVLRRINGKWRMFNKHTKKVEGRAFEHKEEAAIETHKQDIKEDKQIDKGEEQEHKEHPEFSKKSAKQIAIDHIKEHPDMYKKGKGAGKLFYRHGKHGKPDESNDVKGIKKVKKASHEAHKFIESMLHKDEPEEYGDAPSEEVYTGRHEEGRHGVGRGSGGFAKKCKKCHEHPRLANEDYCIDCLSQEDLDRHMAERNINEYLDERKHRGWMERGGEPEEAGEGRGSGGSDNSLKLLHEYNALVRGMEQTMDEKTLEDYSRRLTKVRRTLVKRHGDIPSWEEAEGRGSGKILNPYDKEALMGRGAGKRYVSPFEEDWVWRAGGIPEKNKRKEKERRHAEDKQMQSEIESHARKLREKGRGSDMGNMTYPKITSGYKLHDGPNVTSGGRMHKTASHGGKGGNKSLPDPRSLSDKVLEDLVTYVDKTKHTNPKYITFHEGVEKEYKRRKGRGSGKILNPYDKDYVLGRGGDFGDGIGEGRGKSNRSAIEESMTGKKSHTKNVFSEELPDGRMAIYSYGHHFPMAIVNHKKGEAIMNKDKYSTSTSRHQYHTRRAFEARGITPSESTTEEMKRMIDEARYGRGGDRPPMNLDIKKGALHKQEHIPQGQKIPTGKLESLKAHGTPLERKRANFALVARSWKH